MYTASNRIQNERRAAIYVRISDDRLGVRLGVERQSEDCHKLADRLGWTVAGVYEDNDISAFSGRVRPAYRRLMEDLESGRVDAVLAWHPDRLHRRPVELERFMEVIESKAAAVATVQAGEVDLSTPSGRLMARQLGSFARYESEHKAERIRRALAQRRQMGRPHGGPRTYGYDRDQIVPEEAEQIRWAVQRLCDGAAWNEVVRGLGERGALTTRGKPWDRRSLKRLLISPRLRGHLEHGGAIIQESAWKGIITTAEWARIQERLQTGDIAGQRTTHLLSGILRCGKCGRGLVHGSARTKPRIAHATYLCAPTPSGVRRGCGGTTILQHLADDTVSAIFLDALGTPKPVTDVPSRVSTLEAQIAGLRTRQAELAGDIAKGSISLTVARQADEQISTEIAAVEAAISDALAGERVTRLTRSDVLDTWTGLSTSERRSFINDVIDHIDVRPVGRGWHSSPLERLDVVWRR